MSQKYKAFLQQAQRDRDFCANCGHTRISHLGEGPCSLSQIGQCKCQKFVEGKDAQAK
jgi:hypothetical protein